MAKPNQRLKNLSMAKFNRNEDIDEQTMLTFPPTTTWNGSIPPKDVRQDRGTTAKFSVGDGGVTLDWYEAHLLVNLRIDNSDGVPLNDGIYLVPGTFSLIKNFWLRSEGVDIYTGKNISPIIFIRKLLETSEAFSETASTNELFTLDTSKDLNASPVVIGITNADNKGAAKRFIKGGDGYLKIPLKNWGFFKALRDTMLPNLRLELEVLFEDDAKVLFGNVKGRLIITSVELRVPKVEFANQTEMMKNVLKDNVRFYFTEESILEVPMQKSLIGTTNISKGIIEPLNVFVFNMLSAKKTIVHRGYDFVTFGNGMDFESMVLQYGADKYFPDQKGYGPKDFGRMYDDAIEYAYKVNNPNGGGPCLEFKTWKDVYPFIHFDMRKMPSLGSSEAKDLILERRYTGTSTEDHTMFVGIIRLIEANFRNEGGKITIVRR